MINALKGDEILRKAGGRFRLSALIQRRLKELIEGSRPLVDAHGKTMVEIAVQEIAEGKIAIDLDHSEGLSKLDSNLADQSYQSGQSLNR